MAHLARDALNHGRNGRFHHCFGDEDGMQWLKRHLANPVTILPSNIPRFESVDLFKSLLNWEVEVLGATFQGVSTNAPPLKRSRFLIKITKIRLLSMKFRIRKILGVPSILFFSPLNVEGLPGYVSDTFFTYPKYG